MTYQNSAFYPWVPLKFNKATVANYLHSQPVTYFDNRVENLCADPGVRSSGPDPAPIFQGRGFEMVHFFRTSPGLKLGPTKKIFWIRALRFVRAPRL